jgi:hypothetical protein
VLEKHDFGRISLELRGMDAIQLRILPSGVSLAGEYGIISRSIMTASTDGLYFSGFSRLSEATPSFKLPPTGLGVEES